MHTLRLKLFLISALSNGSILAAEQHKALDLPTVTVIGNEPTALEKVSGSGTIIQQETLYQSHVFTTNEALRKAPGVVVRDEEGFGMRPNIGIRGLNPTRSTRVLLLEDGLPLSYAPYGDNASYYHPPVERFEHIEILKGAGQIQFGPQTTAATINYVTPTPPLEPKGLVSFTGGTRAYLNGRVNYGGTIGNFGGLFDYVRKEGDGARDNTFLKIDDVNLKGLYQINADQSIILRGNFFREDSKVTYTGITDAERRAFGLRYNPFKNDVFNTERWGLSATHQYQFNDTAKLTTSFYWTHFTRDWWRQSSTTTDTQCGEAFRNARFSGVRVDPDGCSSIQGRLRDYYTYGIEPRLHLAYSFFGIPSELDTGFRAHYEEQFRRQENAKSSKPHTGIFVEKNERFADAYAGFVQNRFLLTEHWTITPGVRVESVTYERRNRLNGSEGETSFTEILPAFGINYHPFEGTTLFFSFHRGFSPPRAEDAVSNSGLVVDVDPEKSWNYELGIRSTPWQGVALETTLFHLDFANQVVVGSIAGGGTPLAQGKALHQGLEFFGRVDLGEIFQTDHNVYLQAAYTWVATAEASAPFRCLPVDGKLPAQCLNGLVPGSAKGNRLPYAPEHAITATVGYAHPLGVDVHFETVFVDGQFSDFHNAKGQVGPTGKPDFSGQFGRIDSYTIVNLAATYKIKPLKTDLFVSVKNLFDRDYIVDRTRGILPGAPRLVQAGFKLEF